MNVRTRFVFVFWAAALLFVVACSAPATATDYTWNLAGNGNWADAVNWNPNSAAPVSGDTAIFSAATGRTITLASDAVNIVNVTGSGAWTWQTGTLTLDPGGIFNYGSSGASTFSGTLAGGSSGTTSLNVTAGTLTLSLVNTYTGNTTIGNGATVVVGSAAIGTNGAFGDQNGTVTLASGASISNGGSSAAHQVNNPFSMSGNIGFTNANNTVNFGGAITLTGPTTITTATHGNGNGWTFAGALNSNSSTSNSLTKAGSGTLVLSVANPSFTADMFLTAGTLRADNSGGLGSGNTVRFQGGTLSNGTVVTTYANAIVFDTNGALASSNNNTALNLSGTITLAGGISHTVTVNNGTSATSTWSNGIGQTGGANSFVKAGGTILILQGANSYTGSTTINGGMMSLATGAGTLLQTSALAINPGATLQLDNSGIVGNNNNDRIADGMAIAIQGGTLALVGNANITAGTATSETVGVVTVTAAATFTSTAGTSRLAILTLGSGSLTRVLGGATFNFTSATAVNLGAAGTSNSGRLVVSGQSASTFLGGWAIANGVDFAKYNTTSDAGGTIGIQALAGADYATNDFSNSANNVLMTLDQTPVASATINSLNIKSSTARTLTLTGNTLAITSGGIVSSGNSHIIAGGVLTGASGAAELIIQVNSGNTLTVSSTIADNGGPLTVIKGGVGTLVISAPSTTFTGGLVANIGTVQITTGGQSFQGGITINGNATVQITANSQYFRGGINVTGIATLQTGTGVAGTTWNVLGNNAVSLASGTRLLTNGSNGTSTTLYLREVSSSATDSLLGGLGSAGTTNTNTLVMTALNDATFAGAAVGGRSPLLFNGPATWTLTGTFSNLIQGATSIVRNGQLVLKDSAVLNGSGSGTAYTVGDKGTLTFDNTGLNNANRMLDTGTPAALALSGGTFKFIGNASAASTETAGTLTATAGLTATVDIQRSGSQTATMTFASLSRGAGASLNVKYNATAGTLTSLIFTSAPTVVQNIISGVFVNGADFATRAGASTPITPLTLTATADFSTVTGTTNAYVTSGTTNTTLGAPKSVNVLKMDGGTSLDLAGNTLSIGSSTFAAMILKVGSGSATISSATTQQVLSNPTTGEYLVRVDGGDLTISASLSLTGTVAFSKSGSGLLILTPSVPWGNGTTATAADALRVQEGAIRMDAGDTTNFTTIQRVLAGGVFELMADWSPTIGTGDANLNWNANAGGGFAASGATRTFGTALTWNAANQIQDGKPLMLNSTTADSAIVLGGSLDLGIDVNAMNFREIRVADNTGSSNDKAVISGQITGGGQSHLLKTGAGILELTNASNTYSGETVVRDGALRVNGALATVDTSTYSGAHGLVTVMSGGTLGGTGTINRPVLVQGTISPGVSVGALTVGDTTLAGGAFYKFEINDFAGPPGAGWDLLTQSGTNVLTISATSGSKFTFLLTSLNGSTSGLAANFNNGLSYTLLVGHYDSISGFSADKFAVNTSGFTNPLNGTWSVSFTGGDLNLVYTPAAIPEPAHVLLFCAGALLVGGLIRRRRRLLQPIS